MNRTCDGCTKCCEGWLVAEIRGEVMYPGRPCQYVQKNKGCAIYEDRPKQPCQTFNCAWKKDPSIPEWMAPKDSGVIIEHQTIKGIKYVELFTTGQPVDENTLTWFFLWGLGTVGNIKWWNSQGQYHFYGTPEFAKAMQESLLATGTQEPPADGKPVIVTGAGRPKLGEN